MGVKDPYVLETCADSDPEAAFWEEDIHLDDAGNPVKVILRSRGRKWTLVPERSRSSLRRRLLKLPCRVLRRWAVELNWVRTLPARTGDCDGLSWFLIAWAVMAIIVGVVAIWRR